MSIISKMRKQKSVHWPLQYESGTKDHDNYGQPVYGSPEEIDCRWEDVAVEFMDLAGERQVSRSKVFVDREVIPGAVLMLGTLDSIVDETHPMSNPGAWTVRQAQAIPNLRNTEMLRIVYL
jgi:hypothetical protein